MDVHRERRDALYAPVYLDQLLCRSDTVASLSREAE